MPPKTPGPQLPGADGSAVRRVREGFVPVEELRRALSPKNVPDLFERAMLKVTYYCGLRASETGLQPAKAFAAEPRTLDIIRLKGSLHGTYPLKPWVFDDLLAWSKERPKNSPYLFPYPDHPSLPLDRHSVRNIWVRACQRAGLKKDHQHPHVLKHSIATHLFQKGKDVYFVKEWLGHKRLESTFVYVQMSGEAFAKGLHTLDGIVDELEDR